MNEMLLEAILSRLPSLTIGVVGDLFLDRYLDLDATLTEPSIETGLDAYQVIHVRSYPGAAGTVINNLVALGVGRVLPVAFLGDDGEGYELRQALEALSVVDLRHTPVTRERRTPTYTKPMLCETGKPARELNRLDIKNRIPTPSALEDALIAGLEAVWRESQALVILDQVSEENCGVVTLRVRQRLAELAASEPNKFALADSRERISLFRQVSLKPNERECPVADAAFLSSRIGRPVFCTRGERGLLLADGTTIAEVPAYPVFGPLDIVGAGDATSAGIVSARAAGVSLSEAASFGCLVSSITIQQLGTTGTATPTQVREQYRRSTNNRL